MADPRVRNSRRAVDGLGRDGEDDVDVDEGQDEDELQVSAKACGVLRFSEERDPAALTQFVRLRVPPRWANSNARRGVMPCMRPINEGHVAEPGLATSPSPGPVPVATASCGMTTRYTRLSWAVSVLGRTGPQL
uniref:Uncharacterized protein n=1 Tax=Streptomyces sp. NBC_00180 TaxID=2903632 RepID=A0AAU1IDK6_9ACTN